MWNPPDFIFVWLRFHSINHRLNTQLIYGSLHSKAINIIYDDRKLIRVKKHCNWFWIQFYFNPWHWKLLLRFQMPQRIEKIQGAIVTTLRKHQYFLSALFVCKISSTGSFGTKSSFRFHLPILLFPSQKIAFEKEIMKN